MKIAEPTFGMVIEVPPDAPIFIHDPSVCEGRPCVFHNPSNHHMREWEIVMRLDKLALIERTCPHGVGHPDPDSYDYFKSIGEEWVGVHGCDGCCHREEVNEDSGT